MYYFLLSLSALLFGIQFLSTGKYTEFAGHSFTASIFLTLCNGVISLPIMWALNDFKWECTWFTLIMSVVVFTSTMLCGICSLKSLETANLSLYSIFAMLGGMFLPFAVGILFYDEVLSLGKILCFVLIFVSLCFTFEKGEKKGAKKSAWIYYIGVFIFNGMGGVIFKIFTDAPYAKTDEEGYSLVTAVVTVVLAALMLLIFGKKKLFPKGKALVHAFGSGALNRLGNYIILVTLIHLPASVQYPILTGGVMIISTVLAFFTNKKPSKKEIISVFFAFAGVLIIALVP